MILTTPVHAACVRYLRTFLPARPVHHVALCRIDQGSSDEWRTAEPGGVGAYMERVPSSAASRSM